MYLKKTANRIVIHSVSSNFIIVQVIHHENDTRLSGMPCLGLNTNSALALDGPCLARL